MGVQCCCGNCNWYAPHRRYSHRVHWTAFIRPIFFPPRANNASQSTSAFSTLRIEYIGDERWQWVVPWSWCCSSAGSFGGGSGGDNAQVHMWDALCYTKNWMTKKRRDPFCHITPCLPLGKRVVGHSEGSQGRKVLLLAIFCDIVWLGYFLEEMVLQPLVLL